MAFESEFIPLELDQLYREASLKKVEGWRFIQTHAVNGEAGVDLYYSFMKDGKVVNYRVAGVTKDQSVPSITDLFLAAFVFENEARELFGVNMRDIAIDFSGAMYAPAETEPMTFMSPEQKARRDKAAMAARAKEAKDSGAGAAPARKGGFAMTPERQARLDAKLATMSPEKVAKVMAALKARAAENAAASAENGQADNRPAEAQPPVTTTGSTGSAAASASVVKDATLESKLASMDPDKANRVRTALAGKQAEPQGDAPAVSDEPQAVREADEQLQKLVSLMDDEKAQVVRKALNMKEGE